MNTYRKTSIIVGILYIIGTLSGAASALITGPLLGDTLDLGKIAASGSTLSIAAFVVLLMGLSLAFVPLVLYRLFKRHNEHMALGYVIFRSALETVFVMVTVVVFLLLGTVARQVVGTGVEATTRMQSLSGLLLAGSDWFAAIAAIVFGFGAIIYNLVLFRTKLIPRWISVWGLVSAVLYIAEPLLLVFGVKFELLFASMGLEEMVMAVWLIAKGFNKTALEALPQQ